MGAITLGLLLSPRRTLRAMRAARGQRNLYRDPRSYQEILALSVVDLRESLGVPREGCVARARR